MLAAIGAWLVEMPRNGANTFCCGAGGGRIWMDDSGLRERPSEQRIREAVGLGKVTDFVTACPKDLTMYTAAAKATGHDGDLAVRDLIELVAAAIDLPGLEARPRPLDAPADAVAGASRGARRGDARPTRRARRISPTASAAGSRSVARPRSAWPPSPSARAG